MPSSATRQIHQALSIQTMMTSLSSFVQIGPGGAMCRLSHPKTCPIQNCLWTDQAHADGSQQRALRYQLLDPADAKRHDLPHSPAMLMADQRQKQQQPICLRNQTLCGIVGA